ncbi:MAG: glycosyltransferase [Bacteroidales bacterium]|nr:glycosyltransferase [Bacteroidales bacterium]
MKVLFDLHVTQSYGTTRFHGGGKYGQTLFIMFMSNRDAHGMNVSVVVTKKIGIDFPEDITSLIERNGVRIVEVAGHGDIPLMIRDEAIDVFYSALPETYIPFTNKFPCGPRYIGTIHGLRDLEIHYTKMYVSYQRKRMSQVRQRLREVFRGFYEKSVLSDNRRILDLFKDGIITDSLHTKHQLKICYPGNILDIDVLFPIHFDSTAQEDLGVVLASSSYFLCLNCNRPVKNVFAVMKAVQSFSIAGLEEKKIACVGFSEYHKKLIRKKYPKALEKTVFIDYVEEAQLNSLYAHAFALLYPSVSEGFGYPPLEAMKYGTPVIASCVSSIPEVCGNAALYFDPYDIREIANRIQQVCTEPELRKQLSACGKQRYKWYLSMMESQRTSFMKFLLSKIHNKVEE